ncbi:MAG: sugar phosphate isomerase/epimerase [Chloroflexota bacterium]|nr:MAG: sugar phosphate isomerase/epimerase [Chloroflexota bacterium]
MSTYRLAVSTWSLHANLGPIRLSSRDTHGNRVPWVWEQPKTLDVMDFPAEARRQLGVSRLEICQMHLESQDPAYLDRLTAAVSAAGATIVNVPIDVGNISAADARIRGEDLAEIESWIDAAARIGAGGVRVNTNGPPPMAGEPVGGLDVTIDSYKRLADRCDRHGITLHVENHGGISSDVDKLIQLIESVGPDRLRLCLDVGNYEPVISAQSAVFHGEPWPHIDPSPLYDAVTRTAKYTGVLHAKTMKFDEQGNHLGWDVGRALKIVADSGFTGDISIEYGGGVDEWENCRRTRALIERVLGPAN